MSKGAFHIPSLDGLRAVSFLIVFIAHAGLDKWVPGGFGVTVFFFLSGFLITTLMRMEWEKKGAVSFRAFYLRRVLRILPPFYLVLCTATLLTALGVLQGTLSLPAVLAQFLHYANYWIVGHDYSGQALGTGVYWSLAVEEHFYFLFPLIYVGMRKAGLQGRAQGLALLGLCGLILVWRCVLVFALDSNAVNNYRTYLASDTRFDSILFGCALAVGMNPVLDGPAPGGEKLWKYVLLPLGIALLLVGFLVRGEAFRETLRYSLQGLGLVPIFVVGVQHPDFWPFRILNTRPAAFVGLLSYSLYLVHHVIIFGLAQVLPDPAAPGAAFWPLFFLRASVCLAVALGISYVIYRLVEQPAAALRKRLAA